MFKTIKKASAGLYTVLFLVNLVLLFVLPNSDHVLGGHIVPWVIAIIMGVLGIVYIFPANKITEPNHYKMLFFGTILVMNLLMIIFSIVDIAGVGANHAMSTIIFVAAPVLTTVTYAFKR